MESNKAPRSAVLGGRFIGGGGGGVGAGGGGGGGGASAIVGMIFCK